jgi:acyl carrier protein
MSTTIKSVKEIVAQMRASPKLSDELSDSADLINEVGLDSIELLQFMLEVQSKLSIAIDFETMDLSYLSSIARFAEFLDTMPSRGRLAGHL